MNFPIRCRISGAGKRGPGSVLFTVATQEDADKSVAFLNAQNDGNVYLVGDGIEVIDADAVVARYNAKREYQAKIDAFTAKSTPIVSPVSVTTPAQTESYVSPD